MSKLLASPGLVINETLPGAAEPVVQLPLGSPNSNPLVKLSLSESRLARALPQITSPAPDK